MFQFWLFFLILTVVVSFLLFSLFFFPPPHTEMVDQMKKVAEQDEELSVEERNLLSVAYKNVIGSRRASWRIVSSIEGKEESRGNTENVKRITVYRKKIEEELKGICNDVLQVLEKHLIPHAGTSESTVFYHKMFVVLLLFFLSFLLPRRTAALPSFPFRTRTLSLDLSSSLSV